MDFFITVLISVMGVSHHYQCISVTQVILLWNKMIYFSVMSKLKKTCIWNMHEMTQFICIRFCFSFTYQSTHWLFVYLDCVLAKENLCKIIHMIKSYTSLQNNVKSFINLLKSVTKLFDWFLFLTFGSKYNIFLFCITLICISIFVFKCSLIMCTLFYKA